MYGLLNRAIQDLVETRMGKDAWTRIAEQVSPDEFQFIAMKKYPDELTYDLIAAVSQESGLTPHEVMDAFGEHWIRYTGHIGHGDMMAVMGNDTVTFLRNLDAMHVRITSLFPELEPPKFVVRDLGDNTYEMEYHSHRPGLWPVVVGMVRGVSQMFRQNVRIRLTAAKTEPVGYDRFELIVEP